MKTYTIEQLSDPETYRSEKGLFGLTRTIAEATYPDRERWLPYRNEMTAGLHPQVVFDYLEAHRQAELDETKKLFAKMEKVRSAVSELESLNFPGITWELTEAGIVIRAPWDGGDLNERLKRVGGRWQRDGKFFLVPADKATSLKRIFTNWRAEQEERAAAATAQNRQQEAARAKAQAERERQWAEERKRDDEAREAQRQQHAKAISDRELVVAGRHKVGDVINGKTITGFGKQWQESSLSHGQLYQPCELHRCNGEPVCARCFMCSKHCGCGEQITYCYAYFD